ncbi:MAG: hypothetical protein CMH22_14780 [Methylophaga sp.]|uniref:GIY-YIG nuclease family protein n=1 Tax=Methylophaga sp. UBA678 TaxID=1946901 RepID=UPI000C433288|nr:GIY-YIG nuclease family protein [Methylophaga sp. UBA678]MAX53239.1 hypothetical protein [Methylophaga sp.]|tara:strand:- start:105912 stop:106391 length:480 start_codon:yes stop_codon:yes gene_type:complete
MIYRPTQSVFEYFINKDILEPDGVIFGEDLDAAARKETNEPYPFTDDANRAGCYLIFDQIEPPNGKSINPIYAGRSNNLSKRLRTHWCEDRDNIISLYQTELEKNTFAKEYLNEYLYDVSEIERSAPTCFAVWFLGFERERMLFEHELIYKCKPLMNKA